MSEEKNKNNNAKKSKQTKIRKICRKTVKINNNNTIKLINLSDFIFLTYVLVNLLWFVTIADLRRTVHYFRNRLFCFFSF